MKLLKLPNLYSQRDARWSSMLLGFNTESRYTIGDYGCMITCLSMYLTALGKITTPDTLNTALKEKEGFIPTSGVYIWAGLTLLYPEITLAYQSPRYEGPVPDSELSNIRTLIDSGHVLLAEIDFNPTTISEDMHYVLLYGYNDNDVFYAADPWTGQPVLLNIYGDPHRVLYRVSAYSGTIPDDRPGVVVDSEIYTRLVSNSTGYDRVCDLLTLPHNIGYDHVVDAITMLQKQPNTIREEDTKRFTELDEKYNKVVDLLDQASKKPADVAVATPPALPVHEASVIPMVKTDNMLITIYKLLHDFFFIKW